MSASDAKRVSFSGADGSNKQAGGALSHVSANEGGRKMGVLYTGYLEKKKVEWISVSFKRRFVVLTNEALHWFKRPDGYDLFGDERGRLSLINILSARVLTDDLSKFELVSTDNIERVFNAPSPDIAEEWVSAVRSALRNSKKITKRLRRRLSEMHGPLDITAGGMDEDEVNVALLSLFSSATGMEWVVTRKPAWGRVVSLRQCHDEDEVLIALNTGGHVRSTCKELRAMALEAQEARVEAAAADACDSGDPGSTGGSSNSTSQNNNNNNNSSSSTAGAAGQPRRHSSVVSSTSTRRLSAQSLRGDGLEEIDGATDLPVEGVPIAATIRLAVSLPPRADSDLSGRNPPTYLEFLLAQLFMDKDSLLVVLLSVLTAAVCLCSLTDILRGKVSKQELMSYPSMLYGISAVLSIATARVTVKKLGSPKAIRQKKDETFSLNIILYGHAFARADTVGEEALPERFVNGCDGDQKEARRRWNQTKRWREEAGADDIIFEYQEHFSVMKNLYPHYHAGRSKWGHPVYYERAGDIQLDQLKVRGVGIDDMIHHWLFVSEWTWRVMAQYTAQGEDPNNERDIGKGVSVIDVKGISMSSLGGDTLKYLKAAMAIGQAHYPDRTFKIFICNAPGWFSMLWKMVKPMINEATQKKISILSKSETLKGLSEVLTLDNIPAYYGGKLDCGISGQPDVCRTQSPDALRLQRYVEKINAGRHRELEADVDAETSAAAAAAGESLPPNMRCGQTEDEQARHNCYKLPLIRKLIAEIDRELEGEGGKSAEEDEAEQEQSAPTTQISASPGEKGEQTSVFSGVACIGEAQGLQKAEERGQGSEQGRAASPVQKLWPGTATAAAYASVSPESQQSQLSLGIGAFQEMDKEQAQARTRAHGMHQQQLRHVVASPMSDLTNLSSDVDGDGRTRSSPDKAVGATTDVYDDDFSYASSMTSVSTHTSASTLGGAAAPPMTVTSHGLRAMNLGQRQGGQQGGNAPRLGRHSPGRHSPLGGR